MKKMFAVGLTCLALLGLSGHVYAGTESTSKTIQQPKYEVPFESAKLIKSNVDPKTGVKVDVYTFENWDKKE